MVVLMGMTLVMTSLSVVRTRHSQAESMQVQAHQQAKLEASLRLLSAAEAGATERVATLRQALDVICKTAELPTQFSVEEYAIAFIPRD